MAPNARQSTTESRTLQAPSWLNSRRPGLHGTLNPAPNRDRAVEARRWNIFEAIIFDCDGVLLDTEAAELQVELDLLARLGLRIDRSTYCAGALGAHRPQLVAFVDGLFRQRLGRALPGEFNELLDAAYAELDQHPAPMICGAMQAVRSLRRPKAVASSSSAPRLMRKLSMTELDGQFAPHIYSADLVARGKPYPDVFEYAAAQLRVHPRACLVIEDSINGVRGGVAAGMTVWGFTGGSHIDGDGAGALIGAGAARVIGSWATAGKEFYRWK
jgi:HAD superfamily hydrolase (TIGR01509 family)